MASILLSNISQTFHISIHELFLSTPLCLGIKFISNPHENDDVRKWLVCSMCSWTSAGWMLRTCCAKKQAFSILAKWLKHLENKAPRWQSLLPQDVMISEEDLNLAVKLGFQQGENDISLSFAYAICRLTTSENSLHLMFYFIVTFLGHRISHSPKMLSRRLWPAFWLCAPPLSDTPCCRSFPVPAEPWARHGKQYDNDIVLATKIVHSQGLYMSSKA